MTRRLGGARRDQVSFLAVLRGTSSYNLRARQLRLAASAAALLIVLTSTRAGWAVPLVLLAVAGPSLNFAMVLYNRGQLQRVTPLRRIAEVTERTEGKQQLNQIAYVEIAGMIGLIAVFSYVVTDLPGWLRLGGLLLAVAFTSSFGHSIYNDHTWFNPAEAEPPWWHELLRLFAGPSAAVLFGAIAVPGVWTAAERGAVLVIAALPVVVSVRVWDLDQIIAVIPGIVEQERRRGRELVVDEVDRALAPSLRELQILTEPYREEAPVLYELAVHAGARLRETLEAADGPHPAPPSIDALLGPVLTLGRAVGVAISIQSETDILSDTNARTAAWVLQDLVGNAINAEATAVDVRLTRLGTELIVAVADDADAMHSGVWKTPGTSSARLERHLISLEGSLELQSRPRGKVITARWVGGRENESHDHSDDERWGT